MAYTVPPFTAFNPADLSAITLSNGNLTATGTAHGGVRSVESFGSGQYYWEYTFTTIHSSNIAVGICTAAVNLATGGITTAGTALLNRFGQIFVGSSSGLIGMRSDGDVVGVAVDIAAALIWFRAAPSGPWNGDPDADPATGTGGFGIGALSGARHAVFFSAAAGDTGTVNFGASGFAGSLPAGGREIVMSTTQALSASRAGLGSVIVSDAGQKNQAVSNVGIVVSPPGPPPSSTAPFVLHPFV